MNLISCKKCGVVLNKSRLEFPELDCAEAFKQALWNGNEHVSTVPCPVCGEKIPEKDS